MKKKPTRSGQGRRKFSASEQLSPKHTAAENLSISTLGEFGTGEKRKIFDFVARWNSYYAPLFKEYPAESEGAARIRQKQREHAIGTLLSIIGPALENRDHKPFKNFVKAIKLAEHLDFQKEPLRREYYEAQCVAEEMGLHFGLEHEQAQAIAKQIGMQNWGQNQPVTPKVFWKEVEDRIGRELEDKMRVRIKSAIGLHWPTGRPPKA